MGFLYNCHRWLLCLPAAYVIFILCLGIPYIQRGAIYLHWVHVPVHANFDAPEFYGIAPGQVRNFQLTTPDGAKIGVWHALPEAVYVRHFQQSEDFSGSLLQSHTGAIPLSVFENALRTHKTVLYSHGNAASRAQSSRASLLRSLSGSTYGACDEGLNFVIYDYRGFADSSPPNLFPPSEEGLIKDARTVWDYIVGSGANPRNISIIGQSLGTGVSAALAHRLITEEKVTPNSLCLIAPFTSIPELLKTYSLFKVIPILQPLSIFPKAQSWLLDTFLTTHFNTKSLIPAITTNIMLIHAQDDIDVHPSHSKSLFEYIHEHHSANVTVGDSKDIPILLPSAHKQSHLSPTPILPSSDDRFKPVIRTHEIAHYGTLHQFSRLHSRSQAIFLDAQRGGHNRVGYSGTALRAMAEMICKPSP
ncbi:hypothetical protein PTTG_25416 [Puccinia triticina 1-1 BBBD Race 1]|uniref:Hydrolase_4 domain-containing protein n=2 Tax=Puccinia triticina TaxID=208348 RepID=A0A180H1Q5_PUCT1|nr:uncharacterized protein PtA15_4A348 [Puccinia triticina]OAV98960.1 hypothetical protein PTTG_25416 [Puccinia triticina 1-1 BBBD Race 1]WAQ83899.1 hypothetical protein PtA15_4A348 [Puccinia triticina]